MGALHASDVYMNGCYTQNVFLNDTTVKYIRNRLPGHSGKFDHTL